MKKASLVLSISLAVAAISGCATSRDTRPIITTSADIPSFEYAVGVSSMDVVTDDATFGRFAEQVVRHRKGVLTSHRFSDDAQLARWYRSLARVYTLMPDYKQAAIYHAKADELQRTQKASLGDLVRRVESRLATSGLQRRNAAYDEQFDALLLEAVRAAPFDEIRGELITWRAAADIPGPDGIRAAAEAITDIKLRATHGVASDAVANEIINWREAYRSLYWLPKLGPISARVLDENAHAEYTGDRWTSRQVSLDTSMHASNVLIGVWDTGVDPVALGDAMWRNPRETANSVDDDGNGFVDDLHGIALTNGGLARPGTLRDLGGLADKYDTVLNAVIAQADIDRGVENAGTDAFKRQLAAMSFEERVAMDEQRECVAQFVHGTHVASIAVAGNPFVKVLAVTHGAPDEATDDLPPTRESVLAEAKTSGTSIAYMRSMGVRIVTMSWLTSSRVLEDELERHGIGATPAERQAIAREWFKPVRDELESAIRESPDMLFVCGAGNFSDDVDFEEYIPAGLRLPNLVTVAAVDRLDRPTGFTSTGGHVTLFAMGSEVWGTVPGGRQAAFSGTSASVPQVANLAAKLLALEPGLSPEQLIAIMYGSGEPVEARAGARAIHPRRALDSLPTRPSGK